MNMKISEILKSIKLFTLDTIFPIKCVGCKKEGEWLCDKCFSKTVLVKSQLCPYCSRLSEKGKICERCKRRTKSNLSGILPACYFNEGFIKDAIHEFKYDGVFDLAEPLANLLINCLLENPLFEGRIIVPVPLHKRKEKQRGFNQSKLLAQKIADAYEVEIEDKVLIRKKSTLPQVSLGSKDRKSNIKNAFEFVGDSGKIKDKKILLIDDVCTTGATLEECAKVLKENDAKDVWALIIARQN